MPLHACDRGQNRKRQLESELETLLELNMLKSQTCLGEFQREHVSCIKLEPNCLMTRVQHEDQTFLPHHHHHHRQVIENTVNNQFEQ